MTVAEGVQRIFQRRSEFIVIGLTGRTGSGCSTAAKVLCRSFPDLRLEAAASPLSTPEQRKYRIVRRFAEKNWQPFLTISVTQVIATFIFDAEEQPVEDFFVQFVKEKDRESFFAEIKRIRPLWREAAAAVFPSSRSLEAEAIAGFFGLWDGEIANFIGVARRVLGGNFAPAFQSLGDNLRRNGSATQSHVDAKRFFALPARVCDLVFAARRLLLAKGRSANIVIDALRNPFEIQCFRERFPSFYLIAVTTQDSDRVSRLVHSVNLSASDIKKLDAKEYPAENKPLAGYDQFVSQNIQACIEKADIFVNNPGENRDGQVVHIDKLTKQLVTFVTLMQHPGLVTPTKVERCMQIAYSAKVNSGCISRQVGAAVTDEFYSVKAVGWNDVPEGQVPCLLREAEDLIGNSDLEAFSEFEVETDRFRKHVEGKYKRFQLIQDTGRSSAFCFKSEYHAYDSAKGKVNQVHTRSLHAEENAFLQISKYGGSGVVGGILFSTASPCELCSKKAFQLGIRHIFYIDPYPGIAMSQILGAGRLERRPKVTLFAGAVGQCFHRLYDPILPYKDEFWALALGSEEEAAPAPVNI